MSQKKTIEPFLWTLFSAGGVMAALMLPIHVILFGIAQPLGWFGPSDSHLFGVVSHPLTRIYLFFLVTFCLFHAGHRFRFTLYDGLQIKHLNELIAVICYGGAILGTILAGYFLWNIPSG